MANRKSNARGIEDPDKQLIVELPEDFKLPPEDEPVRWEKAENCCVAALTATEKPLQQRQYYQGAGNRFLNNAQREIEFVVTMGKPADAEKICVIQYIRNHSMSAGNGQLIAMDKMGPLNRNWAWAAGVDGWQVDSTDDIRCWPERAQDANTGLVRDAQAGTVTWQDFPGPSMNSLLINIQQGGLQQQHFPVSVHLEVKTDILCSDQQLCRQESAAARRQLEALWINSVVASVTWQFDVRVMARNFGNGLMPFVPAAAPQRITNINRTIYKACQGGF